MGAEKLPRSDVFPVHALSVLFARPQDSWGQLPHAYIRSIKVHPRPFLATVAELAYMTAEFSTVDDQKWSTGFEQGLSGYRADFSLYSGGVGVSWVRYIAWTSSSRWMVGPTTAMPRASMERQLRV